MFSKHVNANMCTHTLIRHPSADPLLLFSRLPEVGTPDTAGPKPLLEQLFENPGQMLGTKTVEALQIY
jgi:hypothetical protein